MEISVNGLSYPDWASIPSELREKVASTQADSNSSGVPDAFEGEGRVEAFVHGDTVNVSSTSTSTSSRTTFTVGGQEPKSWLRRLLGR